MRGFIITSVCIVVAGAAMGEQIIVGGRGQSEEALFCSY